LKHSLLPRLLSLLLLVFCLPASAAPRSRDAPNLSAQAVDQLAVAGNACGPAALLNAFRFGGENWQRAGAQVPGLTDKERITTVIRQYGMRPSSHLQGKPRWGRQGVNVADLCDMANEMTAGHFLPPVGQEVFFLAGKETPEALLRRVHRRLESSLAKGLPPVLSIRRYVLRQKGPGGPQWVVLDGHFVTVVSLPRKLPRAAGSFPVAYVDPWGGKMAYGEIRIPPVPVLAAPGRGSPCLEADFPGVKVGRQGVRAGETSALVLTAGVGRW
jgi:hypothetical protein